MNIKKNDLVAVHAGADAGTGAKRVLQVLDGGKRVVVEGVNRVYKHVRKGHPKSPQGGRLSREMPIDISNVALYCDGCGRGVRVGYKFKDDGAKIRVCRRCGKDLGSVSPPNPRYAAKK